jgi:2-polyprenyl-6-methoxyphenol hydroxylase-like FAD-dependent oxidoreductase
MKLFKQEKNALYYELRYFRAPAKLALISGAGIAGLAASFELVARGYKVVIVEKRDTFDRFNVINIDVEAQRFLKKFGLFDEFETSIAARIKEHRYILFNRTYEKLCHIGQRINLF